MLDRVDSFAMTTSWDDGHPLDLRVAELLAKHSLQGTFYLPKENEAPTLTRAEARQIASRFELGAHTVHHTVLPGIAPGRARVEIIDSKKWVEDVSGKQCSVFCFPRGQYARAHLPMIAEAGFAGARTVELLSIAPPRRVAGIALIPTSIQAHVHSWTAYARNAVKRGRFRTLWRSVIYARNRDWVPTAISLLNRARQRGGIFHLWGHSWEIDAHGRWNALERVLTAMERCKASGGICVTNAELCVARKGITL